MNNDTLKKENITVTLTLDEDQTAECRVIAFLEANNKRFIALLPTTGPAAETGEVYLYEYNETDEGDPQIFNIESDEDFEAASDAFDEFLDNSEFDELISEEEGNVE